MTWEKEGEEFRLDRAVPRGKRQERAGGGSRKEKRQCPSGMLTGLGRKEKGKGEKRVESSGRGARTVHNSGYKAAGSGEDDLIKIPAGGNV